MLPISGVSGVDKHRYGWIPDTKEERDEQKEKLNKVVIKKEENAGIKKEG